MQTGSAQATKPAGAFFALLVALVEPRLKDPLEDTFV